MCASNNHRVRAGAHWVRCFHVCPALLSVISTQCISVASFVQEDWALPHGRLPRATIEAFICTPSTALLEGMLAGVPMAAIDYTKAPPYNAVAWCQSRHRIKSPM